MLGKYTKIDGSYIDEGKDHHECDSPWKTCTCKAYKIETI